MKKIKCYQALRVIPNFLILHTKNLSGPKEIGSDVLSGMCIFTWGGNQPAIMDTWFDWKDSLKKFLEGEIDVKDKSAISDFYMTWEQAFIAAFFFLDEYYWEKNNEVSVEEVVDDFEKILSSENKDLFNSNLWHEWLEKAKKSLEYNFEYE